MKQKIILLALLIGLGLGVKGQTAPWLTGGWTYQQQIVGSDTNRRASLGQQGFAYFYSAWKVKQLIAAGSTPYTAGYGMSLVGQQFRVDTTNIASKAFANTKAGIGKKDSLGIIYTNSYFNDLSDFIPVSGYSITNGKINIPPGTTNKLRLNNPTALDEYTFTVRYRITNAVTSAYGLQVGFESSFNNVSQYAYYNEASNAISTYAIFDNSSTTGSQHLPNYVTGDILELNFTGQAENYTITTKNISKGNQIVYSLSIPFTLGQRAFTHNTAYPTISPDGGGAQYEILSITYSSKTKKGGSIGGGDSITHGYNAGSVNGRWSILIGGQSNAGPGDRSSEVLLRINEIISIQPKKVYLMIGTNDDFTTWKDNYKKIVNKLEVNGIQVIKLCPPPNNNRSMLDFKNYLFGEYPNSTIDTYTPLLGSGSNLSATYDSGDGTHPNGAGNILIANTIKASPLYSVEPFKNLLVDSLDISREFVNKTTFSRTIGNETLQTVTSRGSTTNVNLTFNGAVATTSTLDIQGNAYLRNDLGILKIDGSGFLPFITRNISSYSQLAYDLDNVGHVNALGNVIAPNLSNLLPVSAYTHASPPTATSTGKRGDFWVDETDKTLYFWIADNLVAQYLSNPGF